MRAILFDFNGVLVDDEPLHLELFQRVLAAEGIALSAEDYYEHYLGFDDKGCFTEVYRAAGRELAATDLSRLIARKSTFYNLEIHGAGFPIFAGASELLQAAAASDLQLGIVSGALRNEVTAALAQLDLVGAFKVLVTAEDVAAGKPDPEGYRRGLDGLNSLPPLPTRLLHPHEVLAIEDSPAGISAAAACGLQTLGVAQTYPASALGEADQVVEALTEVTLPGLQSRFATTD